MAHTYAEAGVDIDASNRATAALVAQLKGPAREGDGAPITLENGFAGLVQLGDGALAICTDGSSAIIFSEVVQGHPRLEPLERLPALAGPRRPLPVLTPVFLQKRGGQLVGWVTTAAFAQLLAQPCHRRFTRLFGQD